LTKSGIDLYQLEYCGLGGKNPAAAWEDTENWWKNRRVEFVLIQ
jgi:outer membrane protein OmpA-like peptidoglycan-associated protein